MIDWYFDLDRDERSGTNWSLPGPPYKFIEKIVVVFSSFACLGIAMDQNEFNKLHKLYQVPGNTLLYAISPRLGRHFAERFYRLVVLECCTGAGFLTIELAKRASKVVTIEMDEEALKAAQHNVKLAGVESNVQFFHGDVFDPKTLAKLPHVDAAILDPVWGESIANMSPPADLLVQTIKVYTRNIALILPPTTDPKTIASFASDEVERLYLDGEIALICLYMGKLAKTSQSTFKA